MDQDFRAEMDMDFLLGVLIAFVGGMEALGLFSDSDIPFIKSTPWQLIRPAYGSRIFFLAQRQVEFELKNKTTHVNSY